MPEPEDTEATEATEEPTNPADVRAENEDARAEYVQAHEDAAKDEDTPPEEAQPEA